MRFIPTRIHGVLDYLGGLVLIAAPWLFDFARHGPETWVPVGLGIAMIGMAACTRYELGLFKMIPMPTHLVVDGAAGLLLAASPWLFGFANDVWIPHVVFGLGELMAALTTDLQPSRGGIEGPAAFGR
jgi:hypothetical protein